MEEINVGIPRSRNEIHGNGLQSVTTVDVKQPQQAKLDDNIRRMFYGYGFAGPS